MSLQWACQRPIAKLIQKTFNNESDTTILHAFNMIYIRKYLHTNGVDAYINLLPGV